MDQLFGAVRGRTDSVWDPATIEPSAASAIRSISASPVTSAAAIATVFPSVAREQLLAERASAQIDEQPHGPIGLQKRRIGHAFAIEIGPCESAQLGGSATVEQSLAGNGVSGRERAVTVVPKHRGRGCPTRATTMSRSPSTSMSAAHAPAAGARSSVAGSFVAAVTSVMRPSASCRRILTPDESACTASRRKS